MPQHFLCLLGAYVVCGTLASCRKEAEVPAAFADPTPVAVAAPAYFGAFPDREEAPTVEGVALGRQLFADKALSLDGTVSCQSCHKPELAFTDGQAVSFGIEGRTGKRSSMSLSNLAWQSRYFWDGRSSTLDSLAIEPMTRHDEMGLTPAQIDEKLQSSDAYKTAFGKAFKGAKPSFALARRALSQFMRTLVSANSRYDRYLLGTYTPTPAENRGMRLFFTHPDYRASVRGGNCGDCHQTITTAGNQEGMAGFHNNGLIPDALNPDIGLQAISGIATDKGKFKTPSLRNIALTAPYMHDGRFTTLEHVLDHYNADDLQSRPDVDRLIQLGRNERLKASLSLTDQEKQDIISFLHMLTDSTFIQP